MFQHLDDVKMSYGEHMLFALKISLFTFIMLAPLTIHAFVPCLFTDTFSKFVRDYLVVAMKIPSQSSGNG
jgi:hypothetical protein